MSKIRSITIQFNQSISQQEVPYFRSAVVKAVGEQASVLLHNHEEERLRYSYPLVQYKRTEGKASLVCIGAGTEAIVPLFCNLSFDFQLGNRSVSMEVESIRPYSTLVQVWDRNFEYGIRGWLPFNSASYKAYLEMEGAVERISFLERILVGNILSMAKGLGIFFDKQVTCKIVQLSVPRTVVVKGTTVMRFDAQFLTNVTLPPQVGLGKHTSFGFGYIYRKRIEKQNIETDEE